MNICSDLTNSLDVGSLALQNKKGTGSGLYKKESSKQGKVKNNEGMPSTVITKEKLPLPNEIQFSSPDFHSPSKPLGISSESLPFFSDPTIHNENEDPETAENTSSNGNKYFSTPMPSKGRVKKKLTPVIEVDIESNTSKEWRSQDKVSRMDIVHKNSYSVDVLPHESPTKTPLYRSFFAAECLEIVNQIEGMDTDVRSPVKRKAAELDVSTIDAEPPPYDCTPMKSMLACEVDNMMCSLDSSATKEGLSLFGESLLDLEKIDMQLHDFNLYECSNKSSKGQSLRDSAIEGIFDLSDGLNGDCINKRQKTEQLGKNECGTNDLKGTTEVTASFTDMVDNFTLLILPQFGDHKKACDIESVRDYSPNKSRAVKTRQNTISLYDGISLGGTTQITAECKVSKLSHDVINLAVLMQDKALAMNISQMIEASSEGLANTTLNIVPVREELTTASPTQLTETDVNKQCANTTQDIVIIHDELPPTDTTQVIEVGQRIPCNTTQDITSVHEEITTENMTHVIEQVSQTSNITQDTSSLHEDVNIASTTFVMEVVSQSPVNTTQDIVSLQEEVPTAASIQVIKVVPQLPANTTLDIASMHEVVTTVNTTQVIDVPQSPVNTTQDTVSMQEKVPTATATQVIKVVPQLSANTTQGIASMHEEVTTANTIQAIKMVSKVSANRTHDVTSIHEEVIAVNTTQESVMQKTCANTEMEFATGNDEVIEASTSSTMAVMPKTTYTEDTASQLDEVIVANKTLFETVPQASSNVVLDMTKKHGVVVSNIPSPSSTEHLNSKGMQLFMDVSGSCVLFPKEEIVNSVEISVSPSNNDLVTKNIKNMGSLNDHKNVPIPSLTPMRETLFLDKAKVVQVPDSIENQKPAVEMTCGIIDNGTIAQCKEDVTQGEISKGIEENCSKSVVETGSSQNEVDICKESNGHPLRPESCSIIQEEENAHDVSVFSVGSLSFVTSTPVPGFNIFQFQKACQDSVHQDPNMSLDSEESINKDSVEQRLSTQLKSLGVQGLNGNNQIKKEISPGSLLPPSTQRSILPSGAITRPIPSTSAIPTARRSLALFHNTTGQNPAKEPMLSKIIPKGIPGRGMIRAPLARQSLPRASLGNLKQSISGTEGSVMTNKLIGSRFRAPKAASAKTRSTATHSQLPIAPSLVKPHSRLCAPNSGRFSLGVQNATTNPQDPVVRPSSGIRTGLPKPGSSSIRPALPLHSQKLSPKLKSNLPGLPVKKTQRELPALEPCKEMSSTKGESTSAARFTTKQTKSSVANCLNEAASFQAGIKSSCSTSDIEQATAENQKKLHSSISSLQESSNLTATSTEKAESERCLHLKTCNCCHVKYHQLLQENEELRRRCGEVQHTRAEAGQMTGT